MRRIVVILSQLVALALALPIVHSADEPSQKQEAPSTPLPFVYNPKKEPRKSPRKQEAPPIPFSFAGLSAVSPDFIRDHHLSTEDLEKLQYYSGGLITLFRLVTTADERLTSGRLTTAHGRNYEVVVIERGTPGIATAVSENEGSVTSISVGFEPSGAINFDALPPLSGVAQRLETRDGSRETNWRIDYGGFQYWIAGCVKGGNEWKEVAQSLSVQSGDCKVPLYVDFSPGGVTGKIRVAPGRTLDK